MVVTSIVLIIIFLLVTQSKIKPEDRYVKDYDLAESIYWKYLAYVTAFSKMYNVPPDVIFAIICVESAGGETVQGKAGEIGLMQISDVALQDVNENFNLNISRNQLYNPYTNIHVGTAYLRLLLDRCNNLEVAIRGYNVGLSKALKSEKYGKTYLQKVNYFRQFFKK